MKRSGFGGGLAPKRLTKNGGNFRQNLFKIPLDIYYNEICGHLIFLKGSVFIKRNIKAIIAAALAAAVCAGLAGCGNGEPTAPENNSSAGGAVSSAESNAGSADSIVQSSGVESTESAVYPTSAGGYDPQKRVPDVGTKPDDSTPLGEFTYNGVTFNLADDLVINDLTTALRKEVHDVIFAHYVLVPEAYHSETCHEFTDNNAGFRFCGGKFGCVYNNGKFDGVHDGADPGLFIESVDETGRIIEDKSHDGIKGWDDLCLQIDRDLSGDDREHLFGELIPVEYGNLPVVGIAMGAGDEITSFMNGMEVGRDLEYYEAILGKGYIVENTNGGEWYNRSIMLIKN